MLPNHFDEYFIPLSSIHYPSRKLATSKNLFYLELTLPQENVLLNLLAQKYGLQHQNILHFLPPLPLNWNLRNISYMKKIPIVNFDNIPPVESKILSILVFCNCLCFVYIWFFVLSVRTFHALGHKSTLCVFSALLCFSFVPH